MKRKLRNILSKPFVREVVAWCGKFYINLIFFSTRWHHLDEADDALKEMVRHEPVIFCVWHGRQFMMPKFWPSNRKLWVVGSTSRDGQLALATAEKFKINLIQRSRMASSSKTARKILRVLGSGHSVGVTPDGSQGPGMRAKNGPVELAKLSGFPLVPATYSCSNAIRLSSWDHFIIPLPFGRGVFSVGTPIYVDRSASPADIEEARCALEGQLNALTAAADGAVGREPVIPAKTPEASNTPFKESNGNCRCRPTVR